MKYILSMEEALEKYDKIIVRGKYVNLLINGVRVGDNRFTNDKVINQKLYRVYDEENNFIGLGKKNDLGFKIEKLLITQEKKLMLIYDNNTLKNEEKNNYIALGSFDGLHLGHLSLVEKVKKLAKQNNGLSIVFTF